MKNKISNTFRLLLSFLLLLFAVSSNAQVDTSQKVNQLADIPLEVLMNIPIVTASKLKESTFDAPFSSAVITKDEIKKSGATSIMEVLRLCPEVIVREQTNGNYDIHVRGLDNVPPNAAFPLSANTTTLVMIDNRPVYNYLNGGTFWETLPVDINDIEKVEIVRGPSSPLYGPNAVSGVINIITRVPEKTGLYCVVNSQHGNINKIISNASLGYKFNDKCSAVLSGNLQNRNRTQLSYYDVVRNEYVESPDSISTNNPPYPLLNNPKERFPHPERSMHNYGFNAFLNYSPRKKINFNVAAGYQNSEVQKIFSEQINASPINTSISESRYADIRGKINKLTTQFSFHEGTNAPAIGAPGWKWGFSNTDAVIDYELVIKNLIIKPGLNYRSSVYDDSKFVNTALKEGIFNGRRELITKAVSLRLDYKMLQNKLRLVAAGRVDKFNFPDKPYFSYQLAATFKPNEKNIFRVVNSKSNRAPFIVDNYINQDFIFPVTPTIIVAFEVRGSEVKLLTSNMIEFGYRKQIKDNLQIDVSAFGTETKNYTDLINGTVEAKTDPAGVVKIVNHITLQNVTLSVRQVGATFSMNYVLKKLQVKPFVTWQYTQLLDYSPYLNTADALPTAFNQGNPAQNNIYSGIGTESKHQGTPEFYGGAYVNYQFHSKFNINLNAYFYSKNTFYHRANTSFGDGIRGIDNLKGKLILNTRLSYNILKHLDAFVNFKNMLNDKSREFYKADIAGFTFLAGINFEF